MTHFIPKHKSDMEAVLLLQSTGDADLTPYVTDLLSWLQDRNWPVANGIAERLSSLGSQLDSSLSEILKGEDDIWKYNLIAHLLPHMNVHELPDTMDQIVRIMNSPRASEVAEEVNMIAGDIMVLYSSDSQEKI